MPIFLKHNSADRGTPALLRAAVNDLNQSSRQHCTTHTLESLQCQPQAPLVQFSLPFRFSRRRSVKIIFPVFKKTSSVWHGRSAGMRPPEINFCGANSLQDSAAACSEPRAVESKANEEGEGIREQWRSFPCFDQKYGQPCVTTSLAAAGGVNLQHQSVLSHHIYR